jgi:hypothetical protein
LLWLDDHPDSDGNLKIRSSVPGAEWFDEVETSEQLGVVVAPHGAVREDGVVAVRISGITGHYASVLNGLYDPTNDTSCRRPIYCKKEDVDDPVTWMWIEYDGTRQQWQIKDTVHRGNCGWALASVSSVCKLEMCVKSGAVWRVASGPSLSHPQRISLALNEAATTSAKLNREDQVDLTLFMSVAAMTAFLSEQSKFVNYPSSLFRIISNRRLFLGTVSVFSCNSSEFLCDGISALLSPGDELTFEGDELFGGVQPGVIYYLASVRRSAKKEYFSICSVRGGEVMALQSHHRPREMDDSCPSSFMVVSVRQRSLLHFLESSDKWRFSRPAICIFHGRYGAEELRALSRRRSDLIATRSQEDCSEFVAFGPTAALQHHG